MTATDNTVVTINYTMKDQKGKVIDSSEKNGPLSYIHGLGLMMPGIEEALNGQELGFKYSGTVPAEKAYGPYIPENVFEVPKEQLGHMEGLEAGKILQVQNRDGSAQLLMIKSVEENTVTIDANHPYAGEEIILECEITDIREASDAEIKRVLGQHSGGCCGKHKGGEGCSNHGDDGGCCGGHH